MKLRISFVWIALSAIFAISGAPRPAAAAFHIMQIEQVIGGVGGDATAQAVQLKMRIAGQNLLNGNAQLVVRDATGANPIVLSNFAGTNPASSACKEILLATPGFSAKTNPSAVPNYTMLSPIPQSYLAGGSLLFQTPTGTVYWRLSWGSYSGPQTVLAGTSPTANDSDGNAAPPFAAALPSSSAQAVRYTDTCTSDPNSSDSTTNAADYALTAGAATFTNNGGASFVVTAGPPIPGLPDAAKLLLPVALGLAALALAVLRRRTS